MRFESGHVGMVSPSSRRAWIEIEVSCPASCPAWVALLAEGVDRNYERNADFLSLVVALLAEGVDRNTNEVCCWDYVEQSPSSRRAWIEIKKF